MPYSACRLLEVLLAGLLALATAQTDPIKNFCRRHGHQTCVIDSKLYIDGGFVYYGTSVTPNSQPESNKRLLWADLNDLGLGVPAQHSNLTKSLEVPSVHGGVLWPDTVNKHFYLFGGIFNEGKVEAFHNLWSFDTVYNNWSEITPDGSQLDILWPSLGASDVTDEGVAYYYGGYAGNDSVAGWVGDTIMLNGLVQYDMNKNTWDNRSYDSTPRAEGNMHYIPASQRGMLVYFGGLEQKTAGNTSYASMSDIHVFDIANSRWFTQTADGEMPQARRGFCSGVAWAEDYSSYNFYIYGGISPNETALGDLWILSLPSFKWIPWYPTVKQEYFPGGKAWSSCNVMQNSKMIVMGGKVVNPERDACDAPTAWGQHGVLLGQESVEKETMWYGLGVDAPKYRVPGNITEVIGGGTEGKATVTAPAGGWQTSDLRVYFQTSYPATLRSATRALPSSSTTLSSIPAPSSSSTNTGAIAGGVVGGVLGLAGILALAWFCLRRRRKQKANDPPPATAMQAPPQHNGAEKFVATSTTTSYPSTFPSPHPNASGYSPQASPPPPSWSEHHSPSTYYHESPPMPQHTWGSHDMPIQYANQQPYYPPPSDPSQSVKHSHTASVELPPNEVLEMPEVRSPMPEVRSPAPKRGF